MILNYNIDNYDGKYLASYPRKSREKHHFYYSLGLIKKRDMEELNNKAYNKFLILHNEFYGTDFPISDNVE